MCPVQTVTYVSGCSRMSDPVALGTDSAFGAVERDTKTVQILPFLTIECPPRSWRASLTDRACQQIAERVAGADR